jgi:hypothetical protein
MCDAMDIEYISTHVWVGVWIFVISVIVAATDASVMIRFMTRFTEEIFSALISLLFIYETFYKLYLVSEHLQHSCYLSTHSYTINPIMQAVVVKVYLSNISFEICIIMLFFKFVHGLRYVVLAGVPKAPTTIH